MADTWESAARSDRLVLHLESGQYTQFEVPSAAKAMQSSLGLAARDFNVATVFKRSIRAHLPKPWLTSQIAASMRSIICYTATRPE
jgi:hypothetical protein